MFSTADSHDFDFLYPFFCFLSRAKMFPIGYSNVSNLFISLFFYDLTYIENIIFVE